MGIRGYNSKFMHQTESKTPKKIIIIAGATFFAFVGSMVTALLFGFVIGFISFVHYPLFVVLSYFFFPAIIGSALGSSYLFLRDRTSSKDRLKKIYRQIILLVILGYLSLSIAEQFLKKQVQLQYAEYEKALAQDNFPAAYQFMTEDYRSKHDLNSFIDDSSLFVHSGRELLPWWTIHVNVFSLEASIDPYQSSFFDYGGQIFYWEKIDGSWYYSGEFAWYVN